MIPPEMIDEFETVYRRIPKSPPAIKDGMIAEQAFGPREYDADGISLTRAAITKLEDAAKGPSKNGYAVVWLTAREIKDLGLTIVASPTAEDPGHCHIPEMTYDNRKTEIVIGAMFKMSRFCRGRVIDETPGSVPIQVETPPESA